MCVCFEPACVCRCCLLLCGLQQSTEEPNEIRPSGSFAYHKQQQGAPIDCASAIAHWERGFEAFGANPPPAYTAKEGLRRPYTSAQARSLIALFNPRQGASLECVSIFCPHVQLQAEGGPTADATRGLLCLSHPDALSVRAPPYT